MKKTKGNKIKLGVFVTVTVALLVAGIYFIGQKQQLFNRTFQVSGVFKDISGLQVGNNVRFSGINVGIVQDIEQVTDSTVKVDMQVDERTRKFIKKNAKAVIGSDGLMGNKIVVIVAGVPGMQELANNDVIATVQPVNVDEILLNLKVTSNNMADITYDLAGIMKNIHDGKGTIGELFMDSSMAKNVNQAFVNIKQGAGGFKNNMDAAGHSFLLRGYLKKKDKDEKNKKDSK
ncbi:MAG TPA: MlaD family protein [Bacteroidia bacterium]|jgi:phospholipid/cholesterol/gamma-HCH transport system substrate-binding protein|nr:MlaD family protein [Bacteroidia bacterium]